VRVMLERVQACSNAKGYERRQLYCVGAQPGGCASKDRIEGFDQFQKQAGICDMAASEVPHCARADKLLPYGRLRLDMSMVLVKDTTAMSRERAADFRPHALDQVLELL